MSYLKEFPDFPPETMPAIPGGFDDVSWHNDSCPSFLNEALGLIVFVDFSEKEKREFPDDDIPRFNVNPWVNGDTGERLVESDDWADILAYIVARQFSVEIKKELSPDQLRLVVTRNKTADYAGGPCASHDFCDANMSMLEAMNTINGRDTMETQTDEDLALWNAAWSIAKDAGFWADEASA